MDPVQQSPSVPFHDVQYDGSRYESGDPRCAVRRFENFLEVLQKMSLDRHDLRLE